MFTKCMKHLTANGVGCVKHLKTIANSIKKITFLYQTDRKSGCSIIGVGMEKCQANNKSLINVRV